MDLITDLARAVGFLSRIPMPNRFFKGHDWSVSRAAYAFPLAGILVVALPAVILAATSNSDPLLAALIALALATLLTGALHEDGLADAADGLGGGRDREHSLEIMKDSRIGTYGVVALILSFGLRAATLAALIRFSPVSAVMALLATAAISRAAMVAHWQALPSARENGVAAKAGAPDDSGRNIALFIGVIAALLLLVPVLGLPVVMFSLLATAVGAYGFTRYVRRKLGGHTGDTIGATQQMSEIVMLVSLAVMA